jgi:SOS-response transcriptional repressor LexA
MSPDFLEGEIIFVDPDRQPVHGNAVVVRTPDGKTTFKRFQQTLEGSYLLIVNPTYPNRRIDVPEGTVFAGVVIGAYRRDRAA